jgi:hypothetical protein
MNERCKVLKDCTTFGITSFINFCHCLAIQNVILIFINREYSCLEVKDVEG